MTTAKTKANTSATVNQGSTPAGTLRKELEAAKAAFESSPTKELTIPKIFQKDFGSNLYISINGVFVNIPINGTPYSVPEPFYNHAMRAINSL